MCINFHHTHSRMIQVNLHILNWLSRVSISRGLCLVDILKSRRYCSALPSLYSRRSKCSSRNNRRSQFHSTNEYLNRPDLMLTTRPKFSSDRGLRPKPDPHQRDQRYSISKDNQYSTSLDRYFKIRIGFLAMDKRWLPNQYFEATSVAHHTTDPLSQIHSKSYSSLRRTARLSCRMMR
jgi:hypothetical protein